MNNLFICFLGIWLGLSYLSHFLWLNMKETHKFQNRLSMCDITAAPTLWLPGSKDIHPNFPLSALNNHWNMFWAKWESWVYLREGISCGCI